MLAVWEHMFSTDNGNTGLAVSSSSRPWMDVLALPEKSNMAVTESHPDPSIFSKEMSHNFVRGQSVAETCFSHRG